MTHLSELATAEEMIMTATTYTVAGMTCEHCVAAVTDELRDLAGVTDVDIDLAPGRDSRVTVTSDATLPEADVRDAVEEAGYVVTGVAG